MSNIFDWPSRGTKMATPTRIFANLISDDDDEEVIDYMGTQHSTISEMMMTAT